MVCSNSKKTKYLPKEVEEVVAHTKISSKTREQQIQTEDEIMRIYHQFKGLTNGKQFMV